MATLLALHAVVALFALLTGRRLGPRVMFVAAAAPWITLGWLAAHARTVIDGGAVEQRVGWVPAVDLTLDLRLDGLALLMGVLVSGIGTAIFVYARSYFDDARKDIGGFAALMTVFAGSMLGVVLADNLLAVYVFWELTSITSYLLIGFSHHKGSARAAALQAILVTGGGGLAMLAGFVVLGQEAGTYSISEIAASPPSGTAVGVAAALIILGACTKSAQVPFHAWLPGAMEAPTPVSAYLHSATLVKAGVYLLARMAPIFVLTLGWWRPVVVAIGAATMLIGGYRALKQTDLKLLLAFGTVSQLGFMVVLVGAGDPELVFAGAALILAHGLFKAVLFMVVGIIDLDRGTRDIRMLSDVGRRMPLVAAVAVVSVASMVGLPALVGFLAKETAYEALLHAGGGLVTAAVVVGSILTFAYGARFLWGAFARKPGATVVAAASPPVLPHPLLVPSLLLATLTVVLGLVPAASSPLVAAAARAADVRVTEPKLLLWHGFTTALALSAVTALGGLALFAARGRVERLQARLVIRASAQRAYEWSLGALNRAADRTTGTLQNGSLPIYIGVILLTVLALPGVALAMRGSLPTEGIAFAESPLQAVVAGVVIAASIAAAAATRRFIAVLLLGAVGYGVAVLFVLQGAPDLALTQLLVETLVLVIFVLVLRHLPERFEPAGWRLGRGLRLAVSGGVGVFVGAFALIAASARRADPTSAEMIERALPDGGGRNVVNVILTDFRAFDTLGEITVLLVAALGIASLVSATGRRSRRTEDVVS
jgi:multicomponent Na+:H+ antiporter subunit A